jgi:hypothetical protein
MSTLIELVTFVATMMCGSVAWWLLSDTGPDDGGGGDGPMGPVLRPNPPCSCSVSVRKAGRRCPVAPLGHDRRQIVVHGPLRTARRPLIRV